MYALSRHVDDNDPKADADDCKKNDCHPGCAHTQKCGKTFLEKKIVFLFSDNHHS